MDPRHGPLVVTIEEWRGLGNVGCVQVLKEMSETHDHFVSFTHGLDLRFAHTGANAALMDGSPVNGPAHVGR